MTVADIRDILKAKVICGEQYLDREVHTGCGSDMMSDVLAFVKDQCALLTGLCNLQVIRTSEMMDIACIIFVRAKIPDETMIELAMELKIPLLCTNYRMFAACGKLYEKGLRTGGRIE